MIFIYYSNIVISFDFLVLKNVVLTEVVDKIKLFVPVNKTFMPQQSVDKKFKKVNYYI
jgi:hypothetical protein